MNSSLEPTPQRRELALSRSARDRYDLTEGLFPQRADGSVRDLHLLREMVQRVQRRRGESGEVLAPLSSGSLNALRLVQELLARLLDDYRAHRNPEWKRRALEWLEERFGRERLEVSLTTFLDLFPPPTVYRGEATVESALGDEEPAARERVLEEMLLVWLANRNPAAESLRDLWSDEELEAATGYGSMMESLRGFFAGQPRYSAGGGGAPGSGDERPVEESSVGSDSAQGNNLFELLQAPLRAAPDSLAAQLRFLLRWGFVSRISGFDHLATLVLTGLDVLREEHRPVFTGPGGPPPPPPEVPDFSDLGEEEERFTVDRDWMPELVLVAKNTLVWLHQLSHDHGRPVRRLDEIPEEALAQLAGWGFTGLWLIGIWQRSDASRRIKQLCGNTEAAASAYAVEDYRIAESLGGDEAWRVLRRRAAAHGLRLACDMVPNHFGVDSRWVREHPERFLSLPESPFPVYRFTGPDLSADARYSVRIDDRYYDRTDAAVVFQRIDHQSGDVRYIYHGNDGTSLPWNDTAQLDYLHPETQDSIIDTVLDVASRFPVIRFDAAMTLARRHVQRLWYPEPGKGGAIPSRSERAIPREEFLRRMPEEFWRRLVDRINAEAPDTLLLAEAFWMMEGYFVRTLGMHRVYNSAFMHMLRDEDNASFRAMVKNTLEFDPEVLRRFVNYVTNPDEETAIEQLGRGDKYFGICTLMATLPGLPMFGHGQFEGLSEKYGMEYRRAYRDEPVDEALVERHQRQIVPLLRRRKVFAGVEGFRLYDFETSAGPVSQDVLVFSNRHRQERALVLYHNRWGTVRGWVRHSVCWRDKRLGDGDKGLVRQTLGESFDLDPIPGHYVIFRDQVSGLEYIREARELWSRGLYVELGPYQTQVLMDFSEILAEPGEAWRRLAEALRGRGVPSLAEARDKILVQPVQGPVQSLLSASLVRQLLAARDLDSAQRGELLDQVEQRYGELLRQIRPLLGGAPGAAEASAGEAAEEDAIALTIAADVRRWLNAILDLASATLPALPSVGALEERAVTALREALSADASGEGAEDEPADLPSPDGTSAESTSPTPVIPGLDFPAEVSADGEAGSEAETNDDAGEPAASVADDAASHGAAPDAGTAVQGGDAAVLGGDAAVLGGDAAVLGGDAAVASPPPRLLAAEAFPPQQEEVAWSGLLLWAFLQPIGRLLGEEDAAARGRVFLDVWMLGKVVENTLADLGADPLLARQGAAAAELFTGRRDWFASLGAESSAGPLADAWLLDPEIRAFLGVHEFDGVHWFRKEGWRRLTWWMLAVALVARRADLSGSAREEHSAPGSVAVIPDAAIPDAAIIATDDGALGQGAAEVESAQREAIESAPMPSGELPHHGAGASDQALLQRALNVVAAFTAAEEPSRYRLEVLRSLLGDRP
ncbi:MAG: alpha-amylase family glycosyl hydrolase [Acidobacteriota bacterium]